MLGESFRIGLGVSGRRWRARVMALAVVSAAASCAAPVSAGPNSDGNGSAAHKAETGGGGPTLEFLTAEQVGDRQPDIVSTLELRHEMPADATPVKNLSDAFSATDLRDLVTLDRACEQGAGAVACRVALPMLAGSVAVMTLGARQLLTAGSASFFASRFALLAVPGAGQVLMLLGVAAVAYEVYRALDRDAWTEWVGAMPSWQRQEAHDESERIWQESGAAAIPDWLVDEHGEPLIDAAAEPEWKPRTWDEWYYDTTPRSGFDSQWREVETESGPQISNVVLPELVEIALMGLMNADATVELCSQGPLRVGSFLASSFLEMVAWAIFHPVEYVLGELFDVFTWAEGYLGFRAWRSFTKEASGIEAPARYMKFRTRKLHGGRGRVGYSRDHTTCGREARDDGPYTIGMDDVGCYEDQPILCCDETTRKKYGIPTCQVGEARIRQMPTIVKHVCYCDFSRVYK